MFRFKRSKRKNRVSDIDKMYADHKDTLKRSGIPFDNVGLTTGWAMAVTEENTPGKPDNDNTSKDEA